MSQHDGDLGPTDSDGESWVAGRSRTRGDLDAGRVARAIELLGDASRSASQGAVLSVRSTQGLADVLQELLSRTALDERLENVTALLAESIVHDLSPDEANYPPALSPDHPAST
jgi:hypothetical protein